MFFSADRYELSSLLHDCKTKLTASNLKIMTKHTHNVLKKIFYKWALQYNLHLLGTDSFEQAMNSYCTTMENINRERQKMVRFMKSNPA